MKTDTNKEMSAPSYIAKAEAFMKGALGKGYRQNVEDLAALLATTALTEAKAREAKLVEALAPFAGLIDVVGANYRGFIQLLVYPEGDKPANGIREWGDDVRRAYDVLKAVQVPKES